MPVAVDINEVKFKIYPFISQRNGDFYLVYQIDIDQRLPDVRLQIGEKKANNKFYYFFIGTSSFPEYKNVIFRPVKRNSDIIKLFKSDAVFWLNRDKTAVKLKIVND